MKKVKVLFVCLGNICRSPLGAAIAKQKVREQGLESFVEIDSCGTSNYHIGDNADPRTIANALRQGVSIDHCARQLTSGDLNTFDFVFAMDKNNYQNILRISNNGDLGGRIKLMREFDPIGSGSEVPDPYHGEEKDFQEVFDILDRTIENFLTYLKNSVLKTGSVDQSTADGQQSTAARRVRR